MNWYTVLGLASSFALFIPILLIIILKLGTYRSFAALLIYYISVFIYNLMIEGYIGASENVIYSWGIANNMLDAPLMLIFLSYFSPTKKLTQRIKLIILLYVLFELSVMFITGFTIKGITIIIGPGIAIVIYFCAQFFSRYAKIAIESNKSIGKAVIAGSILFSYGCFAILYIMFYIVKTDEVNDAFLIYFMATFFSSLLISPGLIFEWKRIKMVKELKITRKELSEIYKDTNMAAPKRTAKLNLDFDKEVWN